MTAYDATTPAAPVSRSAPASTTATANTSLGQLVARHPVAVSLTLAFGFAWGSAACGPLFTVLLSGGLVPFLLI